MATEREPIGDDERLFRALNPDWVDDEGNVLPAAVDLQGTSVFRDRYLSSPEETFTFVDGSHTQLGSTKRSVLPTQVANPSAPEIAWQVFVHDDPTQSCAAHAEIRFRRATDTSTDNVKPKGPAIKALLRE